MKSQAILSLIEELAVLKRMPRSGWQLRGITNCESIADHCYRMSTLAMVLADMLVEDGVELDTAKVMRIALLHEIGEARIGDIPFPAMRHITDEAKHEAEKSAVSAMVEGLGTLGERYQALWQEFEDASSLEAKLVRAADKLEMMIQVAQYEVVGYTNLEDFWQNAANRKDFDVHPLVSDIMARLVEERQARQNKTS